MVNRIACFFTCGYTEAGAMQSFMKKINPTYDYKQLLPNKTRKRMFFEHHLRQYIETEILREYKDDIEAFGWFDGQYVKLSDRIIDAIQTDVKDYIQTLTSSNEEYVSQVVHSKRLYYSKNTHGDYMLRSILPDNVKKKCGRYFRKACDEIRSFV